MPVFSNRLFFISFHLQPSLHFLPREHMDSHSVAAQPTTRLSTRAAPSPLTPLQAISLFHRPCRMTETFENELLFTAACGTTVDEAVVCVLCFGTILPRENSCAASVVYSLECGHCFCATCIFTFLGLPQRCPNAALMSSTITDAAIIRAATMPGCVAAAQAREGSPLLAKAFDDGKDCGSFSPRAMLFGAVAKCFGVQVRGESVCDCSAPGCAKQTRQLCGNCFTPYCSRPCQKADWRRHRAACLPARAAAVALAVETRATVAAMISVTAEECACATCAYLRQPKREEPVLVSGL